MEKRILNSTLMIPPPISAISFILVPPSILPSIYHSRQAMHEPDKTNLCPEAGGPEESSTAYTASMKKGLASLLAFLL
jgi:hypothetical protein